MPATWANPKLVGWRK